MPFTKWTEIESFEHIVRGLRKWREICAEDPDRPEFEMPVVTYRAKVKLHGTNAAVRIEPDGTVVAQSKKRDITPEDDNKGFARWVDGKRELFRCAAAKAGTTTYFGEWCGPGIESGTAVQQVSHKLFAVFAVQNEDEQRSGRHRLLVHPPFIETWLGPLLDKDDVKVIPWHPKNTSWRVDYGSQESLDGHVINVSAYVKEIEPRDPWVADVFGIEGVCEGLVFYPFVDSAFSDREAITRTMFKAKGELHRVQRKKEAAQVDPEVVTSIEDFVAMFVTEPRLQQALSEGVQGELSKRRTGDFLKWIGRDVKKESEAELEASGLTWKQVAKGVSVAARGWYFAKVEAI